MNNHTGKERAIKDLKKKVKTLYINQYASAIKILLIVN